MHLRLAAVEESAERDLTGLYGWFEQVEELRRGARISLGSSGQTGMMGAADVINVVLTQLIAAGSLGVSYATYRRANPKAPKVIVSSQEGRSVRLPDDPERAQELMVSLAQGDGEPAEPEASDDGAA